jgi:hypothetical protein
MRPLCSISKSTKELAATAPLAFFADRPVKLSRTTSSGKFYKNRAEGLERSLEGHGLKSGHALQRRWSKRTFASFLELQISK